MMQSVAGGAHFGGGLWISARDRARFGLLMQRNGKRGAKQLLSGDWIRLTRTPTSVQPAYGFMNQHMNTDRRLWPSPRRRRTRMPATAPTSSKRWIEGDALDAFLQKIRRAALGRLQGR